MRHRQNLIVVAFLLSATAAAQESPKDWQFNQQWTFGGGDFQALTWSPLKSERRYGLKWDVGPGLAQEVGTGAMAFAAYLRGQFVYDAKEVAVGVGPALFGFYAPSDGHWLGRLGLSLTVTFRPDQ